MKLTKQKLKEIIKEEIKNLNETDNLDTKKLNNDEIKLLVSLLNLYGETGPSADKKNLKLFKRDYVSKLLLKYSNKMSSKGKKIAKNIGIKIGKKK
jgi:hypothetical protein